MIWKSKHIGEKQLVGVRLVNDSFLNLRFAGVELKLSSLRNVCLKV